MRQNSSQSMNMNGLGCVVHMPRSTRSKFDGRGTEIASSLAPSAPVTVYRVDDFPNAPAYMKRSDAGQNLVTYFFPYILGNMVWFDLRQNLTHANDVAAIVSAQRRNAIDGRHIGDFADMRQYDNFCPEHMNPFVTMNGSDKYCPECGYAHAHQNYIANTTVERDKFWIDGWRDKGKTREFLITTEEARGVAASMGDTDRVNAFGISLYLSKQPKPYRPTYRGGGHDMLSFGSQNAGPMRGMTSKGLGSFRSADFESAEIGAGALVEQEVGRDPNRLDHWSAKPSAVLVAYYVSPAEFESIVPREQRTEGNSGRGGFLKSPVGNE